MSSINFVPSADASVVSEHSRIILRAILDSAGLLSCVITSTVRSPAKQARAMFVNIEASSVVKQKELYAAAGDRVIDEYQRLKPLGHGRQVIIDAMEAKINQEGPSNVSKHCADPRLLNVIDIAPSSISNRANFLASLERARISGKVTRYFSPANGDPAYHVEIPQP
jgi:type II secretory pathway pseudopilin PulG